MITRKKVEQNVGRENRNSLNAGVGLMRRNTPCRKEVPTQIAPHLCLLHKTVITMINHCMKLARECWSEASRSFASRSGDFAAWARWARIWILIWKFWIVSIPALVDWETIQSKNWHGAHRPATNRMSSARGLCCRARAGVSSLVPWGFRGRSTIEFKCLKLGLETARLSFVIQVR